MGRGEVTVGWGGVVGDRLGAETTNTRKPRTTIDFVACFCDQIASRDAVSDAANISRRTNAHRL